MIDKILINPKTGEPYKNVPPKVAAQYLDITPEFVYNGLREQRLPIGRLACSRAVNGRITFRLKGS